MQVNIVCVGNLKEKFWCDAVSEYSKRISKFCNFNIIQIKEENIEDKNLIQKALDKEAEQILKYLKGYIVVLDIKGKNFSSEELAKTMGDVMQISSTITFVIGSSFGLSNIVKEKANLKLSFSLLTFPHQLFRVMLVEQIYRVFCIMNNIKYHK